MTQSLCPNPGKMETLKSSLCSQLCSGRTFSKGSSSSRAVRRKDYQLRRVKQQNLFICHVRIQKPMIKVLTELGPGKTSLLTPQTGGCLGIRLCAPLTRQRGGLSPMFSISRDTSPEVPASPIMTAFNFSYLINVLHPNTVTLG